MAEPCLLFISQRLEMKVPISPHLFKYPWLQGVNFKTNDNSIIILIVLVLFIVLMVVIVLVVLICMVITYIRVWINRVRLPILLVVS